MISIIKVTGNCNLRCSYCYVGDKSNKFNLSMNNYKKFIDKLYEELKSRKDNKCQIIFHGGEPLIVGKKYIEEAILYALNKMRDIELKFSMQSNGYSIDEEWIKLFKKYDVKLGISLDGTKRFHDKYRFTINNRPTFDRTLDNILKLKKEGLTDSVLIVYNDEFYGNEDEILDFLIKNDLSCKINPVIKCGEAKTQQKTYSKFLINLFEKYIKSNSTIDIRPLTIILNSILYDKPIGECTFSKSCIQDFICLNYDGNIYPCGRFSNIEKFCYGNIQDNKNLIDSEKLNKLISRKNYNKVKDCIGCKYINICTSGCTMTALVDSDNIYSKTCFCEEYKQLFHFIYNEGFIMLKNVLINEKKKLTEIFLGEEDGL